MADVAERKITAKLKTVVVVLLAIISAVASSVAWGLAIRQGVTNNTEQIERIEINYQRNDTRHEERLDSLETDSNLRDVQYAEIQKDLKSILEKIDELKE